MTDNLIASIENHYENSTLPEKPDEEKVIQTLIKIREELYQGIINRPNKRAILFYKKKINFNKPSFLSS